MGLRRTMLRAQLHGGCSYQVDKVDHFWKRFRKRYVFWPEKVCFLDLFWTFSGFPDVFWVPFPGTISEILLGILATGEVFGCPWQTYFEPTTPRCTHLGKQHFGNVAEILHGNVTFPDPFRKRSGPLKVRKGSPFPERVRKRYISDRNVTFSTPFPDLFRKG